MLRLSLNILPLFLVMRSMEADNDWTHLIFSQSWPATVCRVWREPDPSRTCSFPQRHNAWSIHGIWPSVANSTGPAFCNDSWPFNPEDIKPIQAELEQGWINVENGSPMYDLWKHEWNKHGTCAASIDTLNSQIKFFSQGLRWLRKYTMTSILSEANILPSHDKLYTQYEFYKAVKNKLGVDPNINCLHENGKQYLWELRICFSKSFEIIDCKLDSFRKRVINDISFVSNCNSSGIIYETYEPKLL